MNAPDRIAAGQELPSLELHLTRVDVVRYAGAATDFNPIHYSDRLARAIGLPGVVNEEIGRASCRERV